MWLFRANNTDASSNASSTATASSDEAEAAQTAQQARSSRRDGLRLASEDHLQPQAGPRGISLTRSHSPQARVRSIIANRSPTPSPNPAAASAFEFPGQVMDPEPLQAIITAAVTAATAGQTVNNRAIVEAAVNTATDNHVSAQQSMRRPALPPCIVRWSNARVVVGEPCLKKSE